MATKCSGCNKPILSLDFLECRKCQETYDLLCLTIDIESFNNMSQDSKDQWVCPLCVSSKPKGDNTHTPIGSPACSLNSTYNTSDHRNTTMDRVTSLRGSRKQLDINEACCGSEARMELLLIEMKLLRTEMQEIKDHNLALREQLSAIPHSIASSLKVQDQRIAAQESEIAVLKNDVGNLKFLLNIQEQKTLHNELEIAGIPEASSENLEHVVLVTASRLGVDLTAAEIDDVSRAGPKPPLNTSNKERMPRPIVVKLVRKNKRDELLSAAKLRRNLMSDFLAPGTASRLYFNERLTKANRLLFKSARERARQHNFRFCWVRNGAIFVRHSEKKPAIRIQSELDLERKVGPATGGGSTSSAD